MVSFIGRTEGRFTVPTGGAAVSATIANGAGAQTVTVPAASYYLTAAGGVSGLLSTLQTQLNSTLQGYPTTATTTAAALGYGTWTTGACWLLNDTSGSLAASYGSPTLTATSLTYGNASANGGASASIGFSAGTSKADGGDVFDVLGTDDLIVAWVGYFSATPSGIRSAITKNLASGAGWQILVDNATASYYFQGYNSTTTAQFSTFGLSGASIHAGSWHVGIAVIDRSTGKARIGTKALVSGTSSVTSEVTALTGSLANAAAFRIGDRADNAGIAATQMLLDAAYVVSGSGVATGLSANLSTALDNFRNAINASWSVALSTTTGQVSIGWTGYTTPTWSLSWTSTDLRDLLGHTTNITNATTTQTGTYAARGCWIPDCPLNLEGDPRAAPIVTDRRDSEGPTGITLSLVGNVKYRHRGLVWSHCPSSQVWESQATYTNGSYEKFCKDVLLGQGHAWFTPSSRVQIYWNNVGTATLLGSTFNSNAGVSGWFVKGVSSVEPRKAAGDFAGLWRIDWSEVNCDG